MSQMVSEFVPADLDCSDFAQLEPLYQQLLDRPLASADDVKQWLQDYADFASVVSEYGSRRSIDMSCHTDDEAIEKRYMQFVEEIQPKIKPLGFAMVRKLLDCGFADQLTDSKYVQLVKEWQADAELYRDENIPLQTDVTKLTAEYGKLTGKQLVEFQGKQLTLQQLARFLEETDRAVREEAWKLSTNRRLEDRAAMDDIFDKLLGKRNEIAKNSGKANYRDYVWQSNCRFDYTPEDCLTFGDAIEKVCMPIVKELDEKRKAELGVDVLKPWDGAVDPQGRQPLRPFDADKPMDMVKGVREIFNRVSPALAELYDELKPGKNYDLESRPGKRPGGFQSSLEHCKEPFIFMNAAGTHRDVETMLHEAGHAFHYMDSRHEPLMFVRHAPIEFCEVASMSMELIGCDHFSAFYDTENARRAKAAQLEGILRFFPWMATIDGFQQWLYTHDDNLTEPRTKAWTEIFNRFSTDVADWSDIPEIRLARWQAQLHLFHYPFYYVEYGIAQLGALQVWQNFKEDADGALKNLRKAFALGGSVPLPELFETAGIRFDFSADTLGPLLEMVKTELDALG
ncbi:MAG TPA: M3 family oligoendopeptidase [Phycisphaerales bacterium]|nr:M3 family oligoendopeptidase [Phycisphaerales bacterium]